MAQEDVSDVDSVVRQRGEGEHLVFAGGGTLTIMASSVETGGSLMMFEDRLVRGKTTPLHIHPNLEEAIYVLEGELLVHVAGEELPVREGGLVVVPRGVPHALLATSETGRSLHARARSQRRGVLSRWQ